MMASANPYNNNQNIRKIKMTNTYLGDAIEHDSKKQVGAISLLRSLSLVLEEWEFALDAIPDRHLVDVVDQYKWVESEDEVLHAVDGWEEDLLEVLGGFGRLRHDNIDCIIVELEREAEGSETEEEHDNILNSFNPDKVQHFTSNLWFINIFIIYIIL